MAALSGCLKEPELEREPEKEDPNAVVQPGNDIASGVDMSGGGMPLQYAFSADGRRMIIGAGERTAFYDIDQIKRVDRTFSQSDWWNRLRSNYSSGTDIPARMAYDGTELEYDIGVRFKGFTSYERNNTEKKSFRLSTDYGNDDQQVAGYKNLKFHCAYSDNSFMREVIYGAVNERYMPQVASNYIDLYINGAYWGIWSCLKCMDFHIYLSDYMRIRFIYQQIFSLLESVIYTKLPAGRPGMDLWSIFVLANVRLCLNTDYDCLHHVANYDAKVDPQK